MTSAGGSVVLLSGGIDSAACIALASRPGAAPLTLARADPTPYRLDPGGA
jgi:hypothetical protein